MSQPKLNKQIDTNIKTIKNEFDDKLLKIREIVNLQNEDVKICLIYFGLLANRQFIQDSIVKPILEFQDEFPKKSLIDVIKTSIIMASEIDVTDKVKDICTELMFGKTILFVDGYEEALIIETNERIVRTPVEPESETVLRGPREGFTESLMSNISLLRRKIINEDLKFQYLKIGKETNVYMTYTYIDSLVDTRALDEFQKKLNSMNLDAVVDTNAVAEGISYRGLSPFELVGQTERPDVLAAKLLEGKIGVMMDGTPVAITLPYLLVENFQTNEDYYVNSFFASVSRAVRVIGFLISIFLPGVFVAALTYHWEIIPQKMSIAIAHAQEGLTLPTAVEALFLLLVFEILRESGIRTTSGLGQSMSIVGALVIGQAAVQARVASPFMVIVIALTSITSLINYQMKGVTIFFRFAVLFAASILGLYGILVVSFFLLFHISSLKSFGVQFSELSFPFKKSVVKDSFIRATGQGVTRLNVTKK